MPSLTFIQPIEVDDPPANPTTYQKTYQSRIQPIEVDPPSSGLNSRPASTPGSGQPRPGPGDVVLGGQQPRPGSGDVVLGGGNSQPGGSSPPGTPPAISRGGLRPPVNPASVGRALGILGSVQMLYDAIIDVRDTFQASSIIKTALSQNRPLTSAESREIENYLNKNPIFRESNERSRRIRGFLLRASDGEQFESGSDSSPNGLTPQGRRGTGSRPAPRGGLPSGGPGGGAPPAPGSREFRSTPNSPPAGSPTNAPGSRPTGSPSNAPSASPRGTPSGSAPLTPKSAPPSAPNSPPSSTPSGTPIPTPLAPPGGGALNNRVPPKPSGQTAAAYLVRIDYKGSPPEDQDSFYEVQVWGPVKGLHIVKPSLDSDPPKGSDCFLKCHGPWNFGGPRSETLFNMPVSYSYVDAGQWSIGLIQKIPGTSPDGKEEPESGYPPGEQPVPVPTGPYSPPQPPGYFPGGGNSPKLAPPQPPGGKPADGEPGTRNPPGTVPLGGGAQPGSGNQPNGFTPPAPYVPPGGMPMPMPLGRPAGNGPPPPNVTPGKNPLNQRQPTPNPPANSPPEIPSPSCRYDSFGISGGVNSANAKLDRMDAVLQTIQTVYLAKIDNTTGTINDKLGEKIPGGIGGKLMKVGDTIKKTWDFLQIDRVLNVLTYITVLHNAYMLSNNLAQTLFSAISISLDVFGIENEDGSPLDVGKIVSKWTDGFFKKIFGVETVEGIKKTWAKYNRIYQAATNLLFTMQSMMYSMMDAMEVVGNYVAKIGNAAKIFGVFAENCYGWMNTGLNFTQNRFFNALNKAQEATENLEQIASSIKDIQELGEELYGNKEALSKAMNAEEKKVEAAGEAGKTASKSPEIPKSAEQKPSL